MSDCLFCKIASHEIPAKILFEDDGTLAFLDINPRSAGHTVVISKFHAPSLLGLPEENRNVLFKVVADMDKLLAVKLQPDGITIGINQGKASGQEVDHLHVHLMPRWHSDGGGSVQSVVSHPSSESLDDILKKLKA